MTKPSNRGRGLVTGQLVLQPNEYDILCGKDRLCVSHEGSKRFRAVIETYRQEYANTTTKYQKMTITKEIYERLVQDKCRFLKYNDAARAWEELSAAMARDKVGHALRFANRVNPRKKGKRGRPSKKEIAQQLKEIEPANTKAPPTATLEAVVAPSASFRPEHAPSATSALWPEPQGLGEKLMLPPQTGREHLMMASPAFNVSEDRFRRGLHPKTAPPRLVGNKITLTLPGPDQFRTPSSTAPVNRPLTPLSMAKETTTPLDWQESSARGDETLWSMMEDFITEWDPLNLEPSAASTSMPV